MLVTCDLSASLDRQGADTHAYAQPRKPEPRKASPDDGRSPLLTPRSDDTQGSVPWFKISENVENVERKMEV